MTLHLDVHLAHGNRLPEPGYAGAGSLLGGSTLGRSMADGFEWPMQTVTAPLLGAGVDAVCEFWRSAETCRAGEYRGIAWRAAGGILYGVIELDEADFAAVSGVPPLQAASEAAYRRLFGLLEREKMPYLWRVWNYLAAINEESAGLERYRQFNVGRYGAFIACRQGVIGQVPAACAIGVPAGPLSIAFLAGEMPVVPVENPRQLSAYHYPAQYGPRSPTFSRAVLVHPPGQELLFISGTASIVGHRTVHPGDTAAQCRESLANLMAVIAEANRIGRSGCFDPREFAYRVYVRHHRDFALVRDIVLAQIPDGARIAFLHADICRSDLLVEIEAGASHLLQE